MVINRYLLDSDILVEHLRGRQQARTYITLLESEGELCVSSITVAELYSGFRNDQEREAIVTLLAPFRIIPVDEMIAKRGGLLRSQYKQSHGTGLNDALIAATAELNNATLITFNRRHFPMLNNLQVPYKR